MLADLAARYETAPSTLGPVQFLTNRKHVSDAAAPFAVVVRFTVRPGSEEAFDLLTQEIASGIRERGYDTLIYALSRR